MEIKLSNPNPLFVKFITEGQNPTTYIPPEKRRQIYDYMQKVNIIPSVRSMSKNNLLIGLAAKRDAPSVTSKSMAQTYQGQSGEKMQDSYNE